MNHLYHWLGFATFWVVVLVVTVIGGLLLWDYVATNWSRSVLRAKWMLSTAKGKAKIKENFRAHMKKYGLYYVPFWITETNRKRLDTRYDFGLKHGLPSPWLDILNQLALEVWMEEVCGKYSDWSSNWVWQQLAQAEAGLSRPAQPRP